MKHFLFFILLVVNKYCPISTNINAGSNTFLLANSAMVPLCSGDLIMIYQAQGAAINTQNTVQYGDVLNYNSAGLFEFMYVQSSNGNTITTQTTFTNSYQTAGKTQLIKIPQYTSLVVNAGANVTAKPWKDTLISGTAYRFGGLVVIHANDILNNGSISANGSGFRGGALVNDPGINTGATWMRNNGSTEGAEKGESISGYQSDYDMIGGRYCMGAAANAGGGGNNHNAGGGGGANGFNGSAWTGQGVMIVDANNPLAAWSLSSAYINNSNTLTNSSGGGRGGYSWGDANANALIDPPGSLAWVGDSRREVGGLGGRPLTNINAEARIYFGGGGGAPHQNNSSSSPGSNGGGIIYLIVNNAISGNGTIMANGNHAGNATGCSCDAAPGAGAGGSVVLKTPSVALTQNIQATGGNGGNQMALTSPGNPFAESEGPGGGGGGGFVALPFNAPLAQVTGGQNGISLSGAVTEMISNGATQGATGEITNVTLTFISYSPTNTPNSVISINSTNSIVCYGNGAILSVPIPGNYIWQPGNINSNQIVAAPAISTVYSVSGTNIYGCKVEGTYSLTVSECVGLNTSVSEEEMISIFPNPTDGLITLRVKEHLDCEILIVNLLGETRIRFEKGDLKESQFTLDLNELPKGFYFVQYKQHNSIKLFKLIKE
jgi:hypothetical protein